MKNGKHLPVDQPSVTEFFNLIPDESAAREYLESARWPQGITCIHCGHDDVWKIRGGKLYTCKKCREQFTIRTGTVMEASHIPLQKWLYAMYLLTVSRKGISSIQLAKELGITQKSAWFMAHRLRESCISTGQLCGTVEADETYIGGLAKNMHDWKKKAAGIQQGNTGKAIAFGVRRREDGQIRTEIIQSTDPKDLHAAVKKNVAPGSTVYTDEHRGYYSMWDYTQNSVRHSLKEFVVGDAHTNGIESHWAIIKRAHKGIFHKWSKKHLWRYLNEFSFKANTKGLPAFVPDVKTCGVTTVRAHVAGMEGRRLKYKSLIANV
jgi:transposase-like protein